MRTSTFSTLQIPPTHTSLACSCGENDSRSCMRSIRPPGIVELNVLCGLHSTSGPTCAKAYWRDRITGPAGRCRLFIKSSLRWLTTAYTTICCSTSTIAGFLKPLLVLSTLLRRLAALLTEALRTNHSQKPSGSINICSSLTESINTASPPCSLQFRHTNGHFRFHRLLNTSTRRTGRMPLRFPVLRPSTLPMSWNKWLEGILLEAIATDGGHTCSQMFRTHPPRMCRRSSTDLNSSNKVRYICTCWFGFTTCPLFVPILFTHLCLGKTRTTRFL